MFPASPLNWYSPLLQGWKFIIHLVSCKRHVCMIQPPSRRAGSSSVCSPCKDMCNVSAISGSRSTVLTGTWTWASGNGPNLALRWSLPQIRWGWFTCFKNSQTAYFKRPFHSLRMKPKCLLLQETFPVFSSQLLEHFLDSHSHLSHSAQYFGVPDCTSTRTKTKAFEVSLKTVSSPTHSWQVF